MVQVESKPHGKRVGLFVTCLVDNFRPSVGFSAVKLLEEAGYTVDVPVSQTCCGQPAFNSGDRATAKALGRNILAQFRQHDYVVLPSGSCGGMIKTHLPELFSDEPDTMAEVLQLSEKTYELTSFLVDVAGVSAVSSAYSKKITYHDSCSGLRELGVREQPRALLKTVQGATLEEMTDADVCCGFGGLFCVKYPDLSNAIVDKKAQHITNSGAEVVVAGDMGCLLNIAGKLSRQGSRVEVRHVAEVLAGMVDTDPIIAVTKD